MPVTPGRGGIPPGILKLRGDPKVRVCLLPDLPRRPVVVRPSLVDDRQVGVVLNDPVPHLAGVFVLLEAARLAGVSGRREHQEQRLPARALRGLEDVVELTVRLRVDPSNRIPCEFSPCLDGASAERTW